MTTTTSRGFQFNPMMDCFGDEPTSITRTYVGPFRKYRFNMWTAKMFTRARRGCTAFHIVKRGKTKKDARLVAVVQRMRRVFFSPGVPTETWRITQIYNGERVENTMIVRVQWSVGLRVSVMYRSNLYTARRDVKGYMKMHQIKGVPSRKNIVIESWIKPEDAGRSVFELRKLARGRASALWDISLFSPEAVLSIAVIAWCFKPPLL